MTNSTWFECKNLDYKINNKYLLKDVKLNLISNQTVAILGQNGSGKSTLINIINRLIYPIYKSNLIFKHFGSTNPNIWQLRRKISFVCNGLISRINPYENSKDIVLSGIYGSFSLKNIYRTNKREEELVDSICSELSIQQLLGKSFGLLSDGEQRIILLARAAISDPQVIVLDEPNSMLDITSTYRLKQLINNLSNRNISILFSTHDFSLIDNYVDRIITIKQGKITNDDIPSKVINDYKMSKLFDCKVNVSRDSYQYNLYTQL